MEAAEREDIAALDKALAEIPNAPLDSVPFGEDERGNAAGQRSGERSCRSGRGCSCGSAAAAGRVSRRGLQRRREVRDRRGGDRRCWDPLRVRQAERDARDRQQRDRHERPEPEGVAGTSVERT